LQILEKDIKNIIGGRVRRGRVEVAIQMEKGMEEESRSLELNMPMAKNYYEIFIQLAENLGLKQEIRLESLCQMRDVIVPKSEDLDQERLKPSLERVLNLALDSFNGMREKEGEAIQREFIARLDTLEQYVEDIHKKAPELVLEYQSKLKANVARLTQEALVDENRLAQEVALFAERCDITEEVVRLGSHLEQFRHFLTLDDALGRRLDFLIQEMNREVNTIGSKASDSFISKTVVEMKAELEKLREQVQNVE
jgi:uncharacterized protein (TIGR00255 family)